MKTLIILFLFSCAVTFPQWKKEKIMDTTIGEKVHDLSIEHYVVLSSDKGIKRDYYLLNTDYPSSKEFIISKKNYEKDYVKFSSNGQFIVFQNRENERYKIMIYNILSKGLFEIIKPDGDIVSASIINPDNVLYQLRKPNDLPQIFFLNSVTNFEKLITIGIGEDWAPDGEYFFVIKINEEPRKKITRKKNINRSDKKGSITIYNSNGNEVLSLPDLPLVTNAKWSPDSRRIAIKTLDKNGLYIVQIGEGIEPGLTIKKTDYYSDNEQKYINDPVWSPDSKYLFYKKTIEDGHKILATEIWCLNVETKEDVLIENSQNTVIDKIIVTDNYNVFIIQGNDIGNTSVINKIHGKMK